MSGSCPGGVLVVNQPRPRAKRQAVTHVGPVPTGGALAGVGTALRIGHKVGRHDSARRI